MKYRLGIASNLNTTRLLRLVRRSWAFLIILFPFLSGLVCAVVADDRRGFYTGLIGGGGVIFTVGGIYYLAMAVKKFITDRIAICFTIAGIVLMALMIAWDINPSRADNMPHFLKANMVGDVAEVVLCITCLPVMLTVTAVLPHHWPESCLYIVEFFLQGFVFFMLGVIVSVCKRKIFTKATEQDATGKVNSRP